MIGSNGMPTEGYGVPNNPRASFQALKFADARFDHRGGRRDLTIKMIILEANCAYQGTTWRLRKPQLLRLHECDASNSLRTLARNPFSYSALNLAPTTAAIACAFFRRE